MSCSRLLVALALLPLTLFPGFAPPSAAQETTLTVVSAQPDGEVASLQQAAEIRVRFSEPMVALGRIPEEVVAPYFSVRPAIQGTFRWAGPTTLVFRPDPRTPLPYATRYQVTIAATATAVSGRRLAQGYSFTFTTPTVRLLETTWYRRDGRFDRQVVIALRFNQPVRPADVLPRVAARYEPHEWTAPVLAPAERVRMGAEAARFDAKVAASRATAASSDAIPLALAATWDRERFPPSPDLVVLETSTPPRVDGWVQLTLDGRVAGAQGAATPGRPQAYTMPLEPALFVDAFSCQARCDGDSYNSASLRADVRLDELRRRVSVRDVTGGGAGVALRPLAQPRQTYRSDRETVAGFTAEDLGYERQTPARTWAYTVDASLTAADGQTLGYGWTGLVENWHDRAFVSFGDGHGVWEAGAGPLPFFARNFTSARQWLQALTPERLMPTILALQNGGFRSTPPGAGTARNLPVQADQIQSHGLNLSGALGTRGTGLVWAAIRPGTPIGQARALVEEEDGRPRPIATVVQVTNLGITVKDSPQNTLVFVTRLDTGEPVAEAEVAIVRLDNSTAWRGRTNRDGLVVGPALTLRNAQQSWEFSFLVTAAKDGDIAYVGSDWNEGIEPYTFGFPYNLDEAQPILRGTVFSDRGVYRLGEEVHVKAILRQDTPRGIELIPAGTPLHVVMRDARDRVVDRRTVTINAWSTAEWATTLPTSTALGNYQVSVSLDTGALEPRGPARRDNDEPDGLPAYRRIVSGGFLVAAYRRPDFRVDTSLGGGPTTAGATLRGVVSARYLFGAAMQKRPVGWRYSREPVFDAPPAVRNRYPAARYVFVGCCDGERPPSDGGPLEARTGTLNEQGQLALDLPTQPSDGYPYQYTLEGDVEDVSRQRLAGRASVVVHPAPWYIGLRRPSMFVAQADGLSTEVIAASPDGAPVPGVKVSVSLVEVQYHSVRRAEGNGFYTWDTERRERSVGTYTVTTATAPVPLAIPLDAGGAFVLRATAEDGERKAITEMNFYAVGAGYTAWERYDHNRIELVPEQTTYKPGDTARLMVKSPWEQATGLLTVEREGIRTQSTFRLTSTQQTVSVPIGASDIPNVFVSVLLVKGRSAAGADPADTSDPGKPAFRLGYTNIAVEDTAKRLTVGVRANRDEFRPAGSAKVDVTVADSRGGGTASEVTLWAVDYGVLSLTGYRTPDVLRSVYVEKALQVMTSDNRQRIVSRRVLTPKGETDGGDGGGAGGANQARTDFRALAFWLGSVTTDARGRASATVTLPESLTTYRIMAVAGDRASRFGAGDSDIRINKPVVLKPAFPRFLTRGDTAHFGAVVTSQLRRAGTAVVTMRSLDPGVIDIVGGTRRQVQVAAGGSVEVRFDAIARGVGRGRVQIGVRLNGEDDAFEESIPVQVAIAPETVAAFGEAAPEARVPLELPAGVVPGLGGLRLEVASTALVGLQEGAGYVVDYPYGCAEQRASRLLVMATASDLGGAFSLPGIDARSLKARTQTEVNALAAFQCPSGGYAFWAGDCRSVTPYVTSYVLDVAQTAAGLGYDVDAEALTRAYDYLERELAAPLPTNDGWWPAFTAWEAFAVKVLAVGGRNQDSHLTRLYGYRDRMPVFALTYLLDAMAARREAGARPAELRRRIENAIQAEAGTAHVEELSDPYLLFFWNSNVRSTALALGSKVRSSAPLAEVSGLVRWLVQARRNGRWGNTQENALAIRALVDYYRRYESVTPDFTAVVSLGTREILREAFAGRTTTSAVREVPLAQLGPAPAELSVRREGTGTAFYSARLSYVPESATLAALESGFRVERSYAVVRESGDAAPGTTFAAGDLIRVTLSLDLPTERRYVAVTDPVAAGFEPVESWFATTATDLARANAEQGDSDEDSWDRVWRRGTFDHVERHDDRVDLFATRLAPGHHEFSYVVRATTSGVFAAAPTRVEEMYAPEVFGRGAAERVEVAR